MHNTHTHTHTHSLKDTHTQSQRHTHTHKYVYTMYVHTYLVSYFSAILAECLVADPLGQRYAGYPPWLGAGHLLEARPKEVLGHLSGLAAPRVPRYQHHLQWRVSFRGGRGGGEGGHYIINAYILLLQSSLLHRYNRVQRQSWFLTHWHTYGVHHMIRCCMVTSNSPPPPPPPYPHKNFQMSLLSWGYRM